MLDVNAQTPYSDLNYDQLKATCQACTKCVLSETRTQVVVGSGPTRCNLMIIGEGPGEQEDLNGVPFIGRAGQLLTKILESAGIQRDTQAYITNTVKCRPPENRTPLTAEIEACKPYLIRQIQLVQPRVLVLLGAPSLKTILEEMTPISKVRGQWYQAKVDYMTDPLYIMPMFHPSFLLRHAAREKGSPKWLTWEDIREVKTALDFCAI